MSVAVALTTVSVLAKEVLDYFQGDKKAEFELALETLKNEAEKERQEHEQALADKKLLEKQLEVEKANAKRGNFIATFGRALVMISCGIGVLCQFLIFPLLNWWAKTNDPNAPQIDVNLLEMIRMFLPLFGIGG